MSLWFNIEVFRLSKELRNQRVTWKGLKKCLICEKKMTYIPIGQQWKIHLIENNCTPVFYHKGCVN